MPATVDNSITALRRRIQWYKAELQKAEAELYHLLNPPEQNKIKQTSQFSSKEKLAIFAKLFAGRDDVYARRFESKTGKSGYSPVCANRFRSGICDLRNTRCQKCPHRVLEPYTEKAIYQHLTGRQTIGIYPLLPGDLCYFLVVDFDKLSFQKDVQAFMKTCQSHHYPAYIERSRSGFGAHVWFFFEDKVPASAARRMANFLINKTADTYPDLLDSFDRLIPNQDQMPMGGFGNLVALPLQKGPRQQGNSVFVNHEFEPYEDQWAFLSKIERIPLSRLEPFRQKEVGVNDCTQDLDHWQLTEEVVEASTLGNDKQQDLKTGCYQPLKVLIRDQIYFEKIHLSPALQTALMRMASFSNPDFFLRQKRRLNTFGIPKIIYVFEDLERLIAIPKGLLEKVCHLLTTNDIAYELIDQRVTAPHLKLSFKGTLRVPQQVAYEKLIKHEYGVLSASTAFGKTVVGIAVMVKRAVPTLILVHRTELLQQWKERLKTFLDIKERDIGVIGSGKFKQTHKLDIALIQTLSRREKLKELLSHYEMVIVDECHHVAAVSFEKVLKASCCRYILGLSATVVRRDGMHPIIYMQCGSCQHRVNQRQDLQRHPFKHRLIVRSTANVLAKIALEKESLKIAELYNVLSSHVERNRLIVRDIEQALQDGRHPVVITNRKSHIDELVSLLDTQFKAVVLQGGMKKKLLNKTLDDFFNSKDSPPQVLLTTGAFLGEGFDDPRLDTLFLALPVSAGTSLIQYIGRLHRLYDQKREVRVYDYRDETIPMAERMFQRRFKRLLAIGYEVASEDESEWCEDWIDTH